jgi:hypothetical protein
MPSQYESKNFINRLQSFYGFTQNKKDTTGSFSGVRPAEKDDNDKLKAVEFPSDIKKYYDYWIHSCHDNATTLKNRLSRYRDLEYMYYNDTVVSSAVELYADEAVQFDSQQRPLIVNAKDKKLVNYINDFFERIEINRNSLREIARSLSLYGDAFTVNSLKHGTGYVACNVVDVTTIKDRLEFNAIRAKKEYARFRGLTNLLSTNSRLEALAKSISTAGSDLDIAKYFNSYLFGYQIEDDLFVPPWAVTHFRLMSSQSEFYPYGRPLLINAISPFRQLHASKNLMALARAAKFPKEVFEVEVNEEMTQSEVFDAVNEARQEYQNLSELEGSKEDLAVGGQIWTAKDKINYKLLENSLKLDDIADIELLKDDIIIATRVPKGFLAPDRGGVFGQSGQALLQQYKPFGRSVLTVQNAILEQLIQMVKLQFIISGDYPEDTDFELSMAFPIVEDPSDRLRAKNETLNLAKAVIDSLSTTLGINGKLPTEVVKDIFQKYSFLDFADIDDWIKKIADENEKLSEDSSKKLNRITEALISESYFEAKRRLNLKESFYNGRHFMTSQWKNPVDEEVIRCYEAETKVVQGKKNKKRL